MYMRYSLQVDMVVNGLKVNLKNLMHITWSDKTGLIAHFKAEK